MLKGDGLVFIKADKVKGVSQKTGQEYEFANMTLSDGLESFKIDAEPALIGSPKVADLRKGDKINILIDVVERFNKFSFIVSDVAKTAIAK